MGPRPLAGASLLLALLASHCARPVYPSQTAAVAEAPKPAEPAPEPQPAAPVAPAAAVAEPARPATASAAAAPDLFATTVRPILQAHCAPCHEPGGRMYDRMPFDKAETLATHQPGVLKRLKGDDRAAFEKWVKTLP